MKLATFNFQGHDRIGIARNDQIIIDIQIALRGKTDIPGTMLELIEMGEKGLDLAQEALHSQNPEAEIPVDNINWLPPIAKPGKIFGVAMNNSASNERKIKAPDHPAFFFKPYSCLVGHKQPIVIRCYYGSVHPEPELAVIIGKTTRDVDAVNAMEHIYGYTIFNDITGNGMRAEDLFQYWALYASDSNPDQLERREQHLSYPGRYKGTDCFGSMGPWLVTKNEIPEPDNLDVHCKVGGETIAEDSTRYYNYKVAELVSFISQFHTLYPGDVISCGTAFKPSTTRKSIHTANFQVVEGPVEISIEGLGTQENPVVVEKREIGQWRLN